MRSLELCYFQKKSILIRPVLTKSVVETVDAT